MSWFGFSALAGSKKRSRPNAEQLYRTFHGVAPRKRMVEVPTPRGPLMLIGYLLELAYRPKSPSRLKNSEFTHELGDYGDRKNMKLSHKPLLATDGYNFFIIKQSRDPHFDPNGRGIIG